MFKKQGRDFHLERLDMKNSCTCIRLIQGQFKEREQLGWEVSVESRGF